MEIWEYLGFTKKELETLRDSNQTFNEKVKGLESELKIREELICEKIKSKSWDHKQFDRWNMLSVLFIGVIIGLLLAKIVIGYQIYGWDYFNL